MEEPLVDADGVTPNSDPGSSASMSKPIRMLRWCTTGPLWSRRSPSSLSCTGVCQGHRLLHA